MQSIEKSISSAPTSVLFIPKLPSLLVNWNILKTHFSQYGKVQRVILNPQQRSATVSFETVVDAEYAKSKGCVWKNKEFQAVYFVNNSMMLDPRAQSERALGYSELETLWSDDDMEQFGVSEAKSPVPKAVESDLSKERLDSKNKKEKPKLKEIKISKSKSSIEKKSKDLEKKSKDLEKKSSKLKHSEKKIRSVLFSVKDKQKQKEAKKKVKEALLELDKKRRRNSEETKDADIFKKTTDTPELSLKERFNALEERDKLIRKSLIKSSDVKTAKAAVGCCPDMCPEKERIMREYRRLVSVYEMIPGTQRMDHTIAVKAYVRSSADQEEPLPHELRPVPVLAMTMSYLVKKIMPLVDDPGVNISEWYDFCWDRLRGIRKDIIQQQLCSLDTVAIIEQCARFHICCYDYFWGADPSVFDEKINTENLMNCLQTLRHMYEDLDKEDIKCPNYAEFNAYMILLNMKTGDLMATYQLFSESLQKEERIQTAVKLYLAFNNAMYSQFFKLVKNSTYLDACLLQRYLYHVRVQALQAIARAYCPPNKSGTIPLKQMKNILKFDTAEDTELFCEGHGIMLKENKRDFSLYRNDFFLPDTKIMSPESSSLVTNKRVPLTEAVTGGRLHNSYSFERHKIHSSFTNGKLNEMASDASDQKSKSSKMFIESIEDEMTEAVDTDEEMPEDESTEYFVCEDRTDGADQKVIAERVFPMDMDDETDFNKQKVDSSSKTDFSETLFKNLKCIDSEKCFNSDLVARKQQSDSSAFTFDLSSVKNEPSKQIQQQSIPFHFGLAAVNMFGENDQLKSDKKETSQFGFKTNVIGQYSEEYSIAACNEKDKEDNLIYDNKAVSSVNSSAEHKIPIKQSFSYSRADENILGSGKYTQFRFNLGTKNDGFCSVESDKSIAANENVSQVLSELDSSGSIKDSSTKNNHNCVVNKENELPTFLFDNQFSNDFHADAIHSKSDSSTDVFKIDELSKREVEQDKEKISKLKQIQRANEEQALKQLKKDLRRRLKSATARHFIRKWKQKIDRLKEARRDFPVLVGISVEQHLNIWGTAVKVNSIQTLSSRLKSKQHIIESVNIILNEGLLNTVKYAGKEIAQYIVSNNSLKFKLRDFSIPYYWKLVVSVPFEEDSFFAKKFKKWLKNLFYGSSDLPLGSVTEENTLHNIPVNYCVHLVTGKNFKDQLDVINGMNSLIFFSISGVENSAEKCKRFKNITLFNKSMKPVTVALVNIGKVSDRSNRQLVNAMNDKLKRCKLKKWTEMYWSDFDSIDQILKFLTSNVDLSNDIHVCTLSSLLNRVAEHVLNVFDSVKIMSSEYSSATMNPNFVINFYQIFFRELEKLVLNSNLKDYDIVPPEFKNLVCYLNKPGRLPHDINFSKTRDPNIIKAFTRVILPHLKPWPPHDAFDLLDMLNTFCDAVGCNNILPRLVRMIELDDDVDFLKNLNKVSWVSVIDLIIRWLLAYYYDQNSEIVIICNETDLSHLCHIDFSLKLWSSNLENVWKFTLF